MGAEQVFGVLTEFRFDIAHAVADSRTLQGELGRISDAADQVHYSMQRVGMSLIAQMGLGAGGVLGTLYEAIKAADKFESTQRSIATIFLSNGLFTGANSFAEAMQASSEAMENMKKTAREFSLPVSDLVSTSKMIGASLVSHGLDDSSLRKSTNLTRGYLKSSSLLGIDPGMAQGELLDLVNGRAHMNSRLTQRLVNETAAMRPYGGGAVNGMTGNTSGLAKFNALEPAKRLDVLTASLMQFGSNAKIVAANAGSMSNQLQRLKDNFTGMFSVLRPIGDAFLQVIKKYLPIINNWVETNLQKITKNIAGILRDLLKDPEKLFVQLQQMRRLKGDVHKAGQVLFIVSMVQGITQALRYFGIELRGGLLMTGLRYLGTGLRWLGAMFMRMGGFTLIAQGLWFILSKIVVPLALLTMLFQGISRGIALAELGAMKWFAANAARIFEMFGRFKDALAAMFAPLTIATEGLGDLFGALFDHSLVYESVLWIFEQFVILFESLGLVSVGALAAFEALAGALMDFIHDVLTLDFGDIKNIGKGMDKQFNDVMDRFYKKNIDVDNSAVSQKTVNIDKIEIQNQFKEQMEPDRIAFTLKEQLVKTAMNPQQAAGRSLRGGLVSR